MPRTPARQRVPGSDQHLPLVEVAIVLRRLIGGQRQRGKCPIGWQPSEQNRAR